MKYLLSFLLGALFFVLGTPAFAQVASVAGASKAACAGQLFDPISAVDWDDVFPITIAGVPLGPNVDPPDMYEPPICVCPGAFGIPSFGVGITYWQPLYISEVEKIAGCSSSLGGSMILGGYGLLNSDEAFYTGRTNSPHSTRMQLHWFEYPLFSVLDMFSSLGCRDGSGFNLLYMSEIDPTWQSDIWAGIFSPESALFASLPAQFSCVVDSIGATAGFPVDPLFWCAGTWGSVYPMSGNAAQSTSVFQVNNLVLAKFLARQSRLGLQFQTIGPAAECNSVPNPIWLKSQFRVDQVWPIPRFGLPLVIGAPPIFQMPPFLTNPPGMDSTVNLIFEGQQCCMEAY